MGGGFFCERREGLYCRLLETSAAIKAAALVLPAPRFLRPAVACACLDDKTDTGKREVKAEAAGAFGGGFGPEDFARLDCLLGMVVKVDGPVGIREHEEVVMSEVHEVEKLFPTGLDAKGGVPCGVAGRGFDGDETVEQSGLFLRVRLEHAIEGVEVVAHHCHHFGEVLLVALGFGKIGFVCAPKIDFRLEQVDLGIGKDDLVVAHEAVEMIAV